uniref:Putative secreted protein n=1 Tax=Anopheles marajoara TaxID=58244 RepID=A0A2M4CB29_9DIPT
MLLLLLPCCYVVMDGEVCDVCRWDSVAGLDLCACSDTDCSQPFGPRRVGPQGPCGIFIGFSTIERPSDEWPIPKGRPQRRSL